jgi:hypothetical protein
MSSGTGGTLLAIGVLAIIGYLAYTFLLAPIEGAGSALTAVGSDIGTIYSGAASDIGNPIAAAQGSGSGFFGWVYSLGQSLNPATAAQQEAQQKQTAYNDQVTVNENNAIANVTPVNGSDGVTYYSTAAVTSGSQATSGNAGSYDELMVEINAYDPVVASSLTLAAFSTMIQGGLTTNQINTFANAMQAHGSLSGCSAYLVSIGASPSQAALFAGAIGQQ